MPDPTDPYATAARDLSASAPSAASDRDETAASAASSAAGVTGFGPPAASGEVGTLGPYRVVKELGKGGMGAVYAALDTRLDRQLALKVMLPQFAADAAARERFLREAKAAAKVKHVHVVTLYEADERQGAPYIAMEFLEGLPLDAYLKKKGSPPIPQVVRIAAEAAAGLAAAHKLGLVHRDVKPANLWLEAPNGTVKVLDFGLARPVDAETELTNTGAVVGTPAYMSPEQARGERVDHRTDLFSLGTVLYRLCAGKVPFAGPSTMAVLMALGMDEPAPVRELNPAVPESLAALAHQLLAKKPEHRPQTAAEVVQRLRAIAQELAAPRAPADLSASQPQAAPPSVVYAATPVTVAPGASPFADLDAPDAEETEAEADEPVASRPERKEGGKGLLLAVGGMALLAAVAVAVVVSQVGRNGEPTAEPKPPEPGPAAPATPRDGGKPPAGSIPVWKPVGDEWVDVLALDEQLAETLPDHTPWTKRQGKWTSGAGKTRSLAVVLPLRASGGYKLVAEVSRDAGDGLLAIGLPVRGGQALTFDLCNPDDPPGVFQGFSGVKGLRPGQEQNPTRTPQKPLADGQVCKVALTVRAAGEQVELQAEVGGGAPIRWAGPRTDIRYHFPLDRIWVYASSSQWTVHSLKFQKIDGEASVLGWGPPGSDPDRAAAEWVLSVGGGVKVVGSGALIEAAKDLPAGRFGVAYIALTKGGQVADADLARLRGLSHLEVLGIQQTNVTDAGLAHLRELPRLHWLSLIHTKVTDAGLVHLRGPSIRTLLLQGTGVTDAGLDVLRDLSGLQQLELGHTTVTSGGVQKFADARPGCRIEWPGGVIEPRATFPPLDPTWAARVRALKPDDQVKEVAEELKRRNPGFDPADLKVQGTAAWLSSPALADLTPLRALEKIENIYIKIPIARRAEAKLADLGPLAGLRLRNFSVEHFPRVTDLSPLRGMPLHYLHLVHTGVTSLEPVRGADLKAIELICSPVKDLDVLAGKPLTKFLAHEQGTAAGGHNDIDYRVLKGMPVAALGVDPKVCSADEWAILRTLPVARLTVGTSYDAKRDAEPIRQFLTEVRTVTAFDSSVLGGTERADRPGARNSMAAVVRQFPNIKTVNGKPAAEFWKEFDAKK